MQPRRLRKEVSTTPCDMIACYLARPKEDEAGPSTIRKTSFNFASRMTASYRNIRVNILEA